MSAGPDQALDVRLHDDLHHALGDDMQEVIIAGFRHQLGKG